MTDDPKKPLPPALARIKGQTPEVLPTDVRVTQKPRKTEPSPVVVKKAPVRRLPFSKINITSALGGLTNVASKISLRRRSVKRDEEAIQVVDEAVEVTPASAAHKHEETKKVQVVKTDAVELENLGFKFLDKPNGKPQEGLQVTFVVHADGSPITLNKVTNVKGIVWFAGSRAAAPFAEAPFDVVVNGVPVLEGAELEVTQSKELIDVIVNPGREAKATPAIVADTAMSDDPETEMVPSDTPAMEMDGPDDMMDEGPEVEEAGGDIVAGFEEPTNRPNPMSWLPVIGLGAVLLLGLVALFLSGDNQAAATTWSIPALPTNDQLMPADLPSTRALGKFVTPVQLAITLSVLIGGYLNWLDAKSRGQIWDAILSFLAVGVVYVPLLAMLLTANILPGKGWSPTQIHTIDAIIAGLCLLLALVVVLMVSLLNGVDYTPLGNFLVTWGGISAITGNSGAMQVMFNIQPAPVLPLLQLWPFLGRQDMFQAKESLAVYAILSSGLFVLWLLEIPRLIRITVDNKEKYLMVFRSLGAIAVYFIFKAAAGYVPWLGLMPPVILFIFALLIGVVLVNSQVTQQATTDVEQTSHRTRIVFRILWDRLAVQLAFFIPYFVASGTV